MGLTDCWWFCRLCFGFGFVGVMFIYGCRLLIIVCCVDLIGCLGWFEPGVGFDDVWVWVFAV